MSATTTSGPTSVHDLDLPKFEIDVNDGADTLLANRLAASEEHWLARTDLGYMVTRYDDVVAQLRDKRWHSAAGQLLQLSGVTDPDQLARQGTSILSAEGDEHTRLRRLVGRAFTPRAADRLRPFMREVVGGLIDQVAADGRCDFAVDICDPYPIPIICELLGAPKEDWQLFSRWADDIMKIFNFNLHEDLPAINKASDELDRYTRRLIDIRRDQPADDLLTDLIGAEEEGDRLTTEELLRLVQAVILGGTDTTRNQLGCAVALFAAHPDQWRLLAEQPELAPQAVDEVMRYFGAVRGTGRIASEDIVYRDVLFPKGTFLALSVSTANRDPGVFGDDPNTFDITRPPAAQTHLTFGAGIHYCLGAALAKAELQEALPMLAARLPGVRIDGEVSWKPSQAGIFGPQHLPIAFEPGH
ncbi:cytochrome P450 [Desertimonas flava]|uniref:cytochrome P450 n=1 Tax=Desertimonas flava TaxID=2064846 RepID=UPI000E352C39|nr:cytochrome P450 [Desertimonas flava]